MIGMIIGSGGKTINKIIEETGATIDIDDDGLVRFAALTQKK
jgi:polyribonucleotide nucleotidyltransferase